METSAVWKCPVCWKIFERGGVIVGTQHICEACANKKPAAPSAGVLKPLFWTMGYFHGRVGPLRIALAATLVIGVLLYRNHQEISRLQDENERLRSELTTTQAELARYDKALRSSNQTFMDMMGWKTSPAGQPVPVGVPAVKLRKAKSAAYAEQSEDEEQFREPDYRGR